MFQDALCKKSPQCSVGGQTKLNNTEIFVTAIAEMTAGKSSTMTSTGGYRVEKVQSVQEYLRQPSEFGKNCSNLIRLTGTLHILTLACLKGLGRISFVR